MGVDGFWRSKRSRLALTQDCATGEAAALARKLASLLVHRPMVWPAPSHPPFAAPVHHTLPSFGSTPKSSVPSPFANVPPNEAPLPSKRRRTKVPPQAA